MHDDLPPADREGPEGEEPLDPLEILEPLDSREAARVRRRDHDLNAAGRDLMRPGMGKVFKQITGSWERNAPRDQKHARKTTRHDR